jgi:predicted ribosomally synthesized peptide with nif11-like leader
MSEEQLAALLSRLKDDVFLREKLQCAPDLDTAVALAEEAGFKVSKADWLNFQASDNLELSDEDLEGVAGGGSKDCNKETYHKRPECQQTRGYATK